MSKRIYLQLVNYNTLQNKHAKMSKSDTKLDSLCDNLEGCKLDVEQKIDDEELFKQPPPQYGDCPICFQRLPNLGKGYKYQTCCGKTICSGCVHAPVYDNQGNKVDNKKCPFCRTPHPKTNEEAFERNKKRMDAGDAQALFLYGYMYQFGSRGLPQDYGKALELWHRSAELGYARTYNSIGNSYLYGQGVEIDKKKARHYYELAAIRGCERARYNLGNNEYRAGNMTRALKHYMIAVRDGNNDSLNKIKELYLNRHATKDDYTRALRLYQEYLGEIKSVQRDKAAAYSEKYQY